jgi:hypothetical protein
MTISGVEQIQGETVTLWIPTVAAIAVAAVVFLMLFGQNRKQRSFSEMFTGSKDPAFSAQKSA